MKIALLALASLCALYAADTLLVYLAHQPYGEAQIRRYYAMPLKGGKTEFGAAGTQNQTCVQALFPHAGFAPCWYACRHREKWITQ